MAKPKSRSRSMPAIVTVGVGLAILIGIAYLADNLTSSNAATVEIISQLQSDSSNNQTAPYPACQAEYDAAIKAQESNSEYRQLHNQLEQLLKRRQELYDIIYNDRQHKYTEEQRRAARWELMLLQQQITEVTAKYNRLHSQIWAAYDQCVENYKANQQPIPWWQRLFGNRTTASSSTSSRSRTTTSAR